VTSTNDGNHGVTPAGSTPGATVGGNDPIVTAGAGLSQTETALKTVLEPNVTPEVLKHTLRVKKAQEALIGKWLEEAVAKPELCPGKDPQALLDEWNLVQGLEGLLPTLHGVTRGVTQTVLLRKAELWKAVTGIYTVGGTIPNDPKVTALVDQTAAALARGPRTQKSTKAPLKSPIPKGKKALRKLALDHAAQGSGEAGTPVAAVSLPPPATPVAGPAAEPAKADPKAGS